MRAFVIMQIDFDDEIENADAALKSTVLRVALRHDVASDYCRVLRANTPSYRARNRRIYPKFEVVATYTVDVALPPGEDEPTPDFVPGSTTHPTFGEIVQSMTDLRKRVEQLEAEREVIAGS